METWVGAWEQDYPFSTQNAALLYVSQLRSNLHEQI